MTLFGMSIDWGTVGLRTAVVVAGLAIWFWSQALIGRQRRAPDMLPGDRLHDWTAGWHRWLENHPRATNALLVISSLFIDLFGLFLIGSALLGPSFAPFLAMIIVFSMRQICQGLCSLPQPPGKIWRHPGFPSLLVTYHVSNDLFFSGHTAIAVLGAIEAVAHLPAWLAAIAVLVAFGQMLFIIVLRGHYTLDVIAGLFAAFVGSALAQQLAPWIDGLLKA